jgi:hypothetical protein
MTEALFASERDARLEGLVRLIREETDALAELLPAAVERQWTVSPVPKPREDTAERSSGGRSDPTGDTALDGRRLDVRESVRRAEALLQESAVRTRGIRLFMEDAIARYDGKQA